MATIQDRREHLIALFTKAIDACIALEADHPGGAVHELEGSLQFEMRKANGGIFRIVSHPHLDLTQPYDPGFPMHAIDMSKPPAPIGELFDPKFVYPTDSVGTYREVEGTVLEYGRVKTDFGNIPFVTPLDVHPGDTVTVRVYKDTKLENPIVGWRRKRG